MSWLIAAQGCGSLTGVRAIAVSGVMAVLVLLVGCVGDTPSSPTGQAGSKGAPCYPNGTCNPGLACLNGTCFLTDAGGQDSGGDAGGTDGSTADGSTGDAGGDAGSPCPFPGTSDPAKVTCDSISCDINNKQVCCVGSASASCNPDPCTTGKELACDEKADCPQNQVCCATGASVQPACPATLTLSTTGAFCKPDCQPGLVLCAVDADCPDPKMHCHNAQPSDSKEHLGVCL